MRLLSRFSLLAFLFLLLTAQASHATSPTVQRQIRQAMSSFPCLMEFGELYTNGFYFIKKENGRDVVQVRTLINPGYELVMSVPVYKPEGDKPLRQKSPAEVELWEIRAIHYGASGKLEVERVYPQTLISPEDWMKLYTSGGDFRSIGVAMRSGLPIANLLEYRDQLRKEADVSW
jgi:hypothetical protein